MTNFEDLSRKELQALAKEHGIKANASNAALIAALQEKLGQEAAASPAAPAVSAVEVLEGPAVNEVHKEMMKKLPEVEEVRGYAVNASVQVLVSGAWVQGIVKKVNKASLRVAVDGNEMSVKMDLVRHPVVPVAVQEEEHQPSDQLVLPEPTEPVPEAQAEPAAEPEVFYVPEPMAEVTEAPMEAPEVPNEPVVVEEDEEAALRALVAAMVPMDEVLAGEPFVISPPRRTSRGSLRPSLRTSLPSGTPNKRTFATTTPTPAPSIRPKTNATQRLRMEALHNKRLSEAVLESKIKRQSVVAMRRTVSAPTPAAAPAAVPAPVAPVLAAVAPKVRIDAVSPVRSGNAQRKGTPNFKKLHAQAFGNSKPLTACVERVSRTDKDTKTEKRIFTDALSLRTARSRRRWTMPLPTPWTRRTRATRCRSSRSRRCCLCPRRARLRPRRSPAHLWVASQ